MSTPNKVGKRTEKRMRQERAQRRQRLFTILAVSIAAVIVAVLLIWPYIRPAYQGAMERPQPVEKSMGDPNAPVKVEEFSDFQCPFCKRFQDETFKQLMAAYPGKIRFVYRHLPLTSIHPEGFPAAEASMCANEQNAFWPFHDKIFENQNKLGSDLYLQIASGLNLDTSAFEECVNANKYKDLVQTDSDFALGLGVQSPPTFFINGLALVGAQPLTAFTQVIDKELAGEIP